MKKMAPLEQEMFANLKVVYQMGKGNDHLVPVLVPTDVAPVLFAGTSHVLRTVRQQQ